MKPNPLALAALFGLLIFVALQTEQKFNAQKSNFTTRQEGDAIVFVWRDEVRFPMSLRLRETFDEARGRVDHIIIDLASPGGAVAEGREVIAVINDMKKTHLVETRVQQGRVCASMCVPIYLQGEKRSAHPTSRWMFHEPSSVDAITGEKVETPEFEQRMDTRRVVDRYFKNSDINPDWLQALEDQWKGKDIWKTGRQLVNEDSGIITDLG